MAYQDKTREQLINEITELQQEITKLKKAEKERAAAGKGVAGDHCPRTAAEDEAHLVCRFLPDGTITFANKAYCRYFGKGKEELVNSTFAPPIPYEDIETIEKHFVSMNRENPVSTHEHRIFRPNGEIRWLSWSDQAFFDDQGNITEFESTGIDVTERKKAEERIRVREMEYRNVLNATMDGFWMSDTQGRFLDVNDAFCAIVRRSRDELLSMSIYDIDMSRTFDETVYHIQQTIEKGSDRFETDFINRDGEIVSLDVSVNYAYFPDVGGRFFSFVRDITKHKQIEASLRENESKFRLLFEKSVDPIFLLENDRIIDCNEAALKIMRCPDKKELVGLRPSELSPQRQPDGSNSVSKEKKIIMSTLKAGFSRFEWVYRNMHGETFWVDVSLVIVPVQGKPIIYAVWRDITEPKIMKEVLKEAEEKFEIISMSGHDGIVLMDNEGNISFINPAAEKILGYTRDEALGKPLHTYIAPENYHEAQKLQMGITEAMPYLKSVKQEASMGKLMELTATRKDGAEVDIELSILSEMVGSQWRLIGIFRDVTERKRAAERLQKSEEKYRKLFEESRDVVFIASPQGKLVDINHAGVELFGYDSKEELLKADISKDLYFNAADRGRYMKEMEKHGYVDMYELVLRRKDGEKVIVSVTANAARDDAGNIILYQGIMRDLTNIKKLEQHLLEYQKLELTGRLIGDISHHFNDILNIILGNAQLAKMHAGQKEKMPEYLSSIEDAVFRAADLVEQLLAFGRRQPMDLKVVNMNDVVADFVKVVSKVIGENITVKINVPAKLPHVKADVARLTQVLLNLVINARDAMSGKGVLTIETDVEEIDKAYSRLHMGIRPGRYVVLSVTDTGVGIDPETMKKIFEPFFTTKETEERKGLGLSVAYGIVKQHGGFIDVESEPGEGSVFKIFLPQAAERAKEKQVSEEPVRGGSETILVAEDEKSLREVALNILEALGYKVVLAVDGQDAVEVFTEKRDSIDLVLLDLVMPRLNGLEAYREMKKIRPSIAALFMTGYSIDPAQTDFILEEGRDLMHKPYTFQALGRKIREVLDKETVTGEG